MLFKLPKKIIKQINNRLFPSIHYLDELKKDLKQYNFYDDALMFKWAQDQYSTSKHLLTLYSIAHGLCAKRIVEIGFGRSSYVLAKAAYENSGIVYGCDNRSFGHLIPKNMVPSYKFTQLKSNEFWNRLDEEKIGVDMAFLDYFSVPSLDEAIILNEICTMLSLYEDEQRDCHSRYMR
jgi:hypothetical protein